MIAGIAEPSVPGRRRWGRYGAVEIELEFKVTTPVALMVGFVGGLMAGLVLAAGGIGPAVERLRGIGGQAASRFRLPA